MRAEIQLDPYSTQLHKAPYELTITFAHTPAQAARELNALAELAAQPVDWPPPSDPTHPAHALQKVLDQQRKERQHEHQERLATNPAYAQLHAEVLASEERLRRSLAAGDEGLDAAHARSRQAKRLSLDLAEEDLAFSPAGGQAALAEKVAKAQATQDSVMLLGENTIIALPTLIRTYLEQHRPPEPPSPSQRQSGSPTSGPQLPTDSSAAVLTNLRDLLRVVGHHDRAVWGRLLGEAQSRGRARTKVRTLIPGRRQRRPFR